MRTRRLLAAPLLAATLTGGAAATYVPISCGCIDPWASIAYAIGRPEMKSPAGLTPRVIADGLAKNLRGKKVGIRDLPFTTSTYDCAVAKSPERTIRCRWWIWEVPGTDLDYKGFDVVVTTTPGGVFQRVQVVPIRHGPHSDT